MKKYITCKLNGFFSVQSLFKLFRLLHLLFFPQFLANRMENKTTTTTTNIKNRNVWRNYIFVMVKNSYEFLCAFVWSRQRNSIYMCEMKWNKTRDIVIMRCINKAFKTKKKIKNNKKNEVSNNTNAL